MIHSDIFKLILTMENYHKISTNSTKNIKKLTHLPQQTSVNIQFHDLTYTISVGRKSCKTLLKSVSGSFKPNHLTAILGPSGAGKTTLLNILSAFNNRYIKATGQVLINGSPRNVKEFRKLRQYIMQEDLLQPGITIYESMTIAASLKLGPELTKKQKLVVVNEILDMLCLKKIKNTLTDRLSGGERKRLSIALELIDNPSVIFLDEPTTGLDELSSFQCISLLKHIAQSGRTVICSVHTPSARIFSMFDHVYALAAGQCIYRGHCENVVRFFKELGLVCPLHYNPADFIIEVSVGEYGDHIDEILTAVNCDNLDFCEQDCCNKIKIPSSSKKLTLNSSILAKSSSLESEFFKKHIQQSEYKCSGWDQIIILIYRMILQHRRNYDYLLLKVLMYISIALLIGITCWQIGDDGSKTIINYKCLLSFIIAHVFISMMPISISLPIEIKFLKREYFNRWYGLKPFFIAHLIFRVFIQLLLSTMFIIIVYLMTGQPLDIVRFSMFCLTIFLIGLASEGLGVIISTNLNIANSVFVGPVFIFPMIVLATYGMGSGDLPVPIFWKISMQFSYIRYGFQGLISAVYKGGRQNLQCSDEKIYCFFKNPKYFIKMIGMNDASFVVDTLMLLLFIVIFNVLGYIFLKQRLLPNKTFRTLKRIIYFMKPHGVFADHKF